MNKQDREVADRMTLAVLHLSGGNPGSIECLLEIMKPINNVLNVYERVALMTKMSVAKIHEDLIYVYYNDICSKDLKCMLYLAIHAPENMLHAACQVQDFSGRILLKEYLDSYYAIANETSD